MKTTDIFYIKDTNKKAFVAVKFTSFVVTYMCEYRPLTGELVSVKLDGMEAYGVRADDPDTEINMDGKAFYSAPNSDAYIGGLSYVYGSRLDVFDRIRDIKSRYWKWDDKEAEARMARTVFRTYDCLTDTLMPDAYKTTAAGYIYSSKEEAEAANAWAVIDFAAPRKAKTYIIRETVEATYEVER